MIDLAREIIGTQPILAAFLAIGLGYLVGQINIGGFSLGVGAVLLLGLGRPNVGYAMIFPSITIEKVIAVQIVSFLAAAGAGG